MTSPGAWASDVKISMPKATPDSDFSVTLDPNYVFTENGLFHNLTDHDISEIRQSAFQPPTSPSGSA